MKTEMKTLHLAIRRSTGLYAWQELDASFEKQEDGEHFYYGHIAEVQVSVPVMTDEEIDKLMAGAELEALKKERERVNAETFRKIAHIDRRIGELTALEDKAEEA
ncbi:coil containing protein [Vibrio phage 137E35-1]|nr:coil containing protein [Vibrio phage 137E35-1]CAH9015869.1 coil containing protein [Vibrio phage 230E39-1]